MALRLSGLRDGAKGGYCAYPAYNPGRMCGIKKATRRSPFFVWWRRSLSNR